MSAAHPETALQIAVVGFLAIALDPETIVFHCPNGGRRDKREAAILKAMGTRPGVADLILLHRARAFCVELKDPSGGRQSIDQLDFAAHCATAGVPYAICRSVVEVEHVLRQWGLPLRARCAA
jgi:hypothetical protein